MEAPALDFGEKPVSYLVYVTVPAPPSLRIQTWTGNQLRISWPVAATGYVLQRASTLGQGFSSAGLQMSVEGSENVSYDVLGSGPQFYRLVK